MQGTPGVLVIDDDHSVRNTLSTALAPTYAVHVASSGEEGLSRYEEVTPDVVLLDVMLPQMSGIAVLRALKRMSADVPVIMMTAYAEVQTAVQAIKLGATDYLEKPFDTDRVLREVQHAVANSTQKHASVREKVVGHSPAMSRVWRLVESFGPTEIPILLQGETGTGKGVVAEAIHRMSKRSDHEFVAIDCATIPEQLAESELFGYEDGAFTGAGKRKRGRVAFADRGTLFLDEIGTLSLATQAKLLTLLEQQHFLPLGARQLQPTHLDVRFIAATNVPLHRAVEDGSFRADVFHRLNGVTIELPPLRDRGADIDLLATHFASELGRRNGKPGLGITPDALGVLRRYDWPGNVRELQRVMLTAVVLAREAIAPEDLPRHIQSDVAADAQHESDGGPLPTDASLNLREIKEWAGREAQKRVIRELQKRQGITQQEMARLLGVDPKTLRSRLKEIASGRPARH
jgi:two-component system, NtrC family, response regulator AtoC